MRFICALLLFACPSFAAIPSELTAALKNFRAEPPAGWSFTQTTTAEGKTTVERCDAAKPAFDRWSLVSQNGRAPKDDELQRYHDIRSRRSRGGTAPKIHEQLDLATLETIADEAERATYRCRLKPAESGDRTAAFLRATLSVHKPTQTVEWIELASTGEFAPAFGVKIAEMKTRMTYSVPSGDTPTLPQSVTTQMRGTAFWFKSLDADLRVTFSDYVWAGKKN